MSRDQGKPVVFSGSEISLYLKLGIRDFTAQVGWVLGLKVWAGGEMPKIAIGITWLNETLDRDYGIEEPYWGPLESGFRIRKIFVFEIQNVGNVSCGVQNPRLWNLDPTNNCNPDSRFHWQRIQNPVPGIQNTRRIIRNPGMSWIPICGIKFFFSPIWSQAIRTRRKTQLTSFPRNLTLPYEYNKTVF